MKPWRIGIAVVAVAILGWGFRSLGLSRLVDKKTVAERVAQYGEPARARLKPYFAKAGVKYPPSTIIIAGFKDNKQLQLYARDLEGKPRFIRAYSILASSG